MNSMINNYHINKCEMTRFISIIKCLTKQFCFIFNYFFRYHAVNMQDIKHDTYNTNLFVTVHVFFIKKL